MQDAIEKTIDLKAPLGRVWRALTDHREFGEWFRGRLDGPFVVGQPSTGNMTYPGYEHLKWDALVEAIEPQKRFVFRWHPGAGEADPDEVRTVVEFLLEEIPEGTRLRLKESGFLELPQWRQADAFKGNEGGWQTQMQNIADYVASHP